MDKKIGLSIVIPVLNESNNIHILTNKIIKNLKKKKISHHVFNN